MIENILATVRKSAVDSWAKEAKKRRDVWPEDPVARTLDYCAGELETVVAQIERETEGLTVAQYAKLRKRSEQTIRAWIRDGAIPAIKGPHGYEIPRTATPKARVHLAKAS